MILEQMLSRQVEDTEALKVRKILKYLIFIFLNFPFSKISVVCIPNYLDFQSLLTVTF